MKKQNIPICISIIISVFALVVSSISLWLSYQNREYDRLVAFEQRKQEVRQLLIEEELLCEDVEKAILEHVKTDETPELREDAAMIWEEARNIRRKTESMVNEFGTIPATSKTKDRLVLEKMFIDAQQQNKKLLELLNKAKQRHSASNKEIRSTEDHNNLSKSGVN